MAEHSISFGDTVRVRSTSETRAAGVAGLVGCVYGQTTPSATGVDMIGDDTADYAINVHFEGRHDEFWFAEALLEFVDHGAGTEITVDGVDKKWTRTTSGDWEETSDDA